MDLVGIILTINCYKEEMCYVYIFTTYLSSKLLQVIIGGDKSNFSGKFKLEPITIKETLTDVFRTMVNNPFKKIMRKK